MNFGNPNFDLKDLSTALLALELIAHSRGSVKVSSKSNLLLRIRKGTPVGCKIVLQKDIMYNFIFKLVSEIFPKTRDFSYLSVSKRLKFNSFSFSLSDLSGCKELSKQFYFFSRLPPLNVTCFIDSKSKSELVYLLKSFKFPVREKS